MNYGKRIYLVLWGGTALILLAMMIINRSQKLALYSMNNSMSGSAYAVNGDEWQISSKSAFVNFFLRYDKSEDFFPGKAGTLIKEYKRIYERSVLKKENQSEDFYIRPVPK